MACACKVGRQLAYLEKTYGTSQPKDNTTHMRERMRAFGRKMLIAPIAIVSTPFILLYVLYQMVFNGGKIEMHKLFRLNKNVGN